MGGLRVLVLLVILSFSSANETCPLPSGIKAPEEVTVAGMSVSQESYHRTVTRLAIVSINKDPCLLPETRLNLVEGYDLQSPATGLSEFLRVQEEHHPVGWSGFAYSSVARAVALASPLSETPMISSLASRADLSDSSVYPFFSRVSPSVAYQGRLLADLCNLYGWDRVAIVSATDAFATSIVEEFTNRAAFHSIRFLSTSTFPLEVSASSQEDYEAQMRAAVRKTKSSGARIIILCTNYYEAASYFKVAMEEGLFGPPYTYIGPEALDPFVLSYEYRDDEDTREKFQENSRGLISLARQGVQPGPVTDDWVETILSADPVEYPGGGFEEFALAPLMAHYRDAMYALAYGIDRLIRRGIDPSNGNALLETIQQETDFVGLTGDVRLKPNGDRYARYDILNSQDFSLEMTTVGWGTEDKLKLKKEIVFSDGTTRIPDAAERIYVDWGDAEAIVMVALFSVGLLVTLGCLIVMMTHRSTPIMNYSSPRFVLGMGAGVLVGLTNVFVWTGEPSSMMCEARPWLLVLNFGLIFGHLYAKAFRVLVVMKQRKTLTFRPIPDIHLFLYVFFYLLLFVIPCIVWTAAFPLDVTRSDDNPDNDKVNIICDGENSEVFLGVLLALGGVSLLLGVVVAFLNRNYHDFFSEATYIGYTMFTVCITCCVVLPMLFILSDTPHAFYIVLMLGVFLANGAVLVFMFFPKVFVIFTPDINVVPLDATGALKTKKSSGRTDSSKKSSGGSDSSKKSLGSDALERGPDVGEEENGIV